MSTKEIHKRIMHIREISGDDESAHCAEDALMRDFIAYVASDLGMVDEDLDKKAKLVLTTSEISFARWCA